MKRIEKLTNYCKRNSFHLPKFETGDEKFLDFIISRLHSTAMRRILEYRKPKTIADLHDMLNHCISLGVGMTLEKFEALYGDEIGKEKYKERCADIAMTKDNMIRKYGLEDGTKRWETYCARQAYTNTLEYKSKKYGMTKEEFDEYNASRACTLENFIQRHGLEDGTKRWETYCARQAYTNTHEHLGDKYEEVNSKKRLVKSNFIRKYGKIEGDKRFQEYQNKSHDFYSKISQKLFWELLKRDPFSNNKCYFAENFGEYGVYDDTTDTYKKYDFVCTPLSLCIEFHGDHYHGNPRLYRPDDKLKGRGQRNFTAKEVWIRDDHKIKLIQEKREIDVLVVWETDWLENPELVIKRILDHVSRLHR